MTLNLISTRAVYLITEINLIYAHNLIVVHNIYYLYILYDFLIPIDKRRVKMKEKLLEIAKKIQQIC